MLLVKAVRGCDDCPAAVAVSTAGSALCKSGLSAFPPTAATVACTPYGSRPSWHGTLSKTQAQQKEIHEQQRNASSQVSGVDLVGIRGPRHQHIEPGRGHWNPCPWLGCPLLRAHRHHILETRVLLGNISQHVLPVVQSVILGVTCCATRHHAYTSLGDRHRDSIPRDTQSPESVVRARHTAPLRLWPNEPR